MVQVTDWISKDDCWHAVRGNRKITTAQFVEKVTESLKRDGIEAEVRTNENGEIAVFRGLNREEQLVKELAAIRNRSNYKKRK